MAAYDYLCDQYANFSHSNNVHGQDNCVDTSKNVYKYANNYVNIQHNHVDMLVECYRLLSSVHASYLTCMQGCSFLKEMPT